MDGTISGTAGEVLSRLDQWSFWGRLILFFGALALLRGVWWLVKVAFNQHSTDGARAKAFVALGVILFASLTVLSLMSVKPA